MLAKIIIVAFLLAILYMLGSSFYFLIRDKGEGRRTVQRLTWRVGLSLLLFLLLYLAFLMGWLKPSSPGPVRYPSEVSQPVPDR